MDTPDEPTNVTPASTTTLYLDQMVLLAKTGDVENLRLMWVEAGCPKPPHRTVIEWAVKCKRTEVVRFLLEETDSNITNRCYDWARAFDQTDVIALLDAHRDQRLVPDDQEILNWRAKIKEDHDRAIAMAKAPKTKQKGGKAFDSLETTRRKRELEKERKQMMAAADR